MSDVNEVIERTLEALRDDVHHKLDITIEEGDWAIFCQLQARHVGLQKEADDALKEISKGGGLRWSNNKRLGEGPVEHCQQDRDEVVLEFVIELVGKAIRS